MGLTRRTLAMGLAALIGASTALAQTINDSAPAKQLFGTRTLPAVMPAASHGFYSKGCLAGAQAIAVDGPNWQAMRLSRNRRWGHPKLIEVVERLSRDVARDGRNGILVGDLSQPRGGPMLTGHASHQIGLDADIWLRDMPERRFTLAERETESAISVLVDGTRRLDERVWTDGHANLIWRAATYPEVERILVHPAIKKKLCESATGDRSWLSKVRPYYGHHYHMHVRIGCQPGSPDCKPQNKPKQGDGCAADMEWWLSDEPWRPRPIKSRPPSGKPKYKRLSDLPDACRTVLTAASPVSEAEATRGGPASALRTAAAEAWLAKAARRTALEPALEDIGLPELGPQPRDRPVAAAGLDGVEDFPQVPLR